MKFLLLALQYFPLVLQGVVSIEHAIGSTIPGTSKKQIFMNAVTIGAKVGEAIPEAHVAVVSQLVDTVVGALNASGVFATNKPAAPPVGAGSLAGSGLLVGAQSVR